MKCAIGSLVLAAAVAAAQTESPLFRVSFDGDRPAGWVQGARVADVAMPDSLERVAGPEGSAWRTQDEIVAITLTESPPAVPSTIALWVRPRFQPTDPASHTFLVCEGDSGDPHDSWQFQWLGQGRLLCRFGTMADHEIRLGPLFFEAGRWVHLAVTRDARRTVLYVDGRQAVVTFPPESAVSPGRMVRIGGRRHGERLAHADLDEVRWYERALTAAEIAVLADGVRGTALGPPPAANRSRAQPAYPPPRSEIPAVVLHADFDHWPALWAPVIGKKASLEHTDGRFGKAIVFTGGGASVSLGGRIPVETGTIAFWVRPSWGAGETDSHVFFHIPTNAPATLHNYHVQLWQGSLSARAGALPEEGIEGANLNSRAVRKWKPDEWHHVAMAWSPRQMVLYLDGERAASTEQVGYPYRPGADVTIGSWQNGTRAAEAVIDEFWILSEPLDQDAVQTLMTENRIP